MDVNNEGFFEQPKWTLDSLEQEIYANTRTFVSLNVMEWLLNRLNTTPQQRKPLTADQKHDLVTNFFSDSWAIEKAMELLDDYEVAHGIKE